MRKILISISIFVLSLFVSNTRIFALCEDDTLNDWAEKLSISFEQVKHYDDDGNAINEDIPYSYLLKLSIPRTDIKVYAKDTFNSSSYEITYDNDYKNFVLGSEVHFVNKVYVITVYMQDSASACASEKMKTITYTVPPYNKYHDTQYCEDNPKEDICGTYVEVDDEDKVEDLIDRYYNDDLQNQINQMSPWYQKAWYYITEYWLYIMIPLMSISIVYIAIILIVKKRSEKE